MHPCPYRLDPQATGPSTPGSFAPPWPCMGHKGEAEHQCQVGKGLTVLQSDTHPTPSQRVLQCIWECIWGLLDFIIRGAVQCSPHNWGDPKNLEQTPCSWDGVRAGCQDPSVSSGWDLTTCSILLQWILVLSWSIFLLGCKMEGDLELPPHGRRPGA